MDQHLRAIVTIVLVVSIGVALVTGVAGLPAATVAIALTNVVWR